MDSSEIDCEALLEQCWRLLNRKYEETYGTDKYHQPVFSFILSYEQIRALQRHATNMSPGQRAFVGIDNQMLFGHPIREQEKTPYLEPRLKGQ